MKKAALPEKKSLKTDEDEREDHSSQAEDDDAEDDDGDEGDGVGKDEDDGDEDDEDDEDEEDEDEEDEDEDGEEEDGEDEDDEDEDDEDEDDDKDEEAGDEDGKDESEEANKDAEGAKEKAEPSKSSKKGKAKKAKAEESTVPKMSPEESAALDARLKSEFNDQQILLDLKADVKVDLSDRKAILQFALKRMGVTDLLPENEAHVQAMRQEKMIMKDPSGHVTAKRDRHFNCDVCGTGGIHEMAYNCSMCDWDCCLKCYKEHVQKVEREVSAMREERQADSGRWRPISTLGFKREAEAGFLNELQEHGGDPVMVRLLCHAIWQLRLSYGAALNAADTTRALALGNNYLDEEGVSSAVCGLLSTASKSLKKTDCGKEIAAYAWACISAFPASDTVVEGALQLLFLFSWDTDEERIKGVEQVTAIRFGVGAA